MAASIRAATAVGNGGISTLPLTFAVSVGLAAADDFTVEVIP